MYGRNHSQRNTSYAGHRHGYQQPYSGPQAIQYGAQRPLQPPAAADPQLWQWFSAVDVDRSGSISLQELQSALLNGNWTRFDFDTVKMLMSIFDTDRSGTIDFAEFSRLWKYIADWQNVFRHFDRDRSGSIDKNELAEALRSFNYALAPPIMTLIAYKYAPAPASGYGPPPGITFDRFVRACVAVKTLTEAFNQYDKDRDGWIQLNYDQFMSIVLSAP